MITPSHYAFSFYAVPTALTTAVIIVLALVTLIRERDTSVSLPFGAVALSIAVWLFAFSWMYCATDAGIALEWAKRAYLGVPFIPTAIYHFTITILGRMSTRRAFVWISWILSIGFVVAVLSTNALVGEVYKYWWGYYPLYGWLSIPYLTFFFGSMIASLWEYWDAYRNATPGTAYRQRIKVFMVAFGVAYLGSFDYLAKYRIPVYPFGYLPILIFVVLTTRAIWRYHLVDLTPSFAADQILETIQGAVLVVDLEGLIRVANRAAYAVVGYGEGELIGRSIDRVMDRPWPDALTRVHLVARGPARDCATVWHTGTGQRVDVSIAASLVVDRNRRPVGVVYVGTDITERKQAEERLAKSEALFRTMSEASPLGIFVADGQGEHVYTNPTYRRMAGLTPRTALPNGWKDAIHPADRPTVFAAWEQAVQRWTAFDETYRFVHDDGQEVWVKVLSAVITDGPILSGHVGLVEDITKRRIMEQEREAKVKELELLNRVMMGREERILELKERVKALQAQVAALSGNGPQAAKTASPSAEERSG